MGGFMEPDLFPSMCREADRRKAGQAWECCCNFKGGFMRQRTALRNMALVGAASVPLALAGCLSSSSGSDGDSDAELHELSAEVTGLGPGELVLDLNGETHEIDEDGTVVLSDEMPEGDDFSLTVAEQPSEPVQDCEPDQGEDEIEGDLTIAVNCLTPVTVEGQVAGEDPDGRSVVMSDGDESWETEADGDGQYELEADLSDPSAVLYIEAPGDPDHFHGYLGEISALQADRGIPEAGDRNLLGPDVTGRVNVNHLTTAMSGGLRHIHGGDEFEEQTELEAAAREVLTEHAATIAGGLVMVSEGSESMPPHADDYFSAALDFHETHDWADSLGENDATSLSAEDYDRGAEPEPMIVRENSVDSATGLMESETSDLDDAVTQAIEEASVATADFDELPASFYIVGGHEWGRFSYVAKAERTGSLMYLRDRDGTSGPGSHTLDEGDLRIDLSEDGDPHMKRYRFVPGEDDGDPSIQCLATYFHDEFIVRGVMDGFGSNMVLHEIDVTVEYDDDQCDWVDDESYTLERYVSLVTLDQNEEIVEDDLPDSLAMNLPGRQWADDPEEFWPVSRIGDIVDLDSGGSGEMRHYDNPIAWEVDEDGVLRISDGQANKHYDGVLVSGESDGSGLMIVEPTHDSEWEIAFDPTVPKEEDLFFTSSDFEGHWEQWPGTPQGDFAYDYPGGDTIYIGGMTDSPRYDERPHRFESVGSAEHPKFKAAMVMENGVEFYRAESFDHEDVPDHDELDGEVEPGDRIQYQQRTIYPVRQEGDLLYFVLQMEFQDAVVPDPVDDDWEWTQSTAASGVRNMEHHGDSEID